MLHRRAVRRAGARPRLLHAESRVDRICSRTPALAKKGLARYDVPVFRLGRLAVDRTVQGRGLGGALLLRAADRCIRVAQDVGGVALLIDAKNDRAARWYESYGALRMDDAPLSLVLPLATAADALKRGI
jgi:GNAT superfamily N-acetyltransferase